MGGGCGFASPMKGKGSGKGNYKTSLCTLFQAGNCTRPTCSFAHGEEELQPFGTSDGCGGGGFAAPMMAFGGMEGMGGGGGAGGYAAKAKGKGNHKTKLCTLFEAGNCPRPQCSFAHGQEEIQGFAS